MYSNYAVISLCFDRNRQSSHGSRVGAALIVETEGFVRYGKFNARGGITGAIRLIYRSGRFDWLCCCLFRMFVIDDSGCNCGIRGFNRLSWHSFFHRAIANYLRTQCKLLSATRARHRESSNLSQRIVCIIEYTLLLTLTPSSPQVPATTCIEPVNDTGLMKHVRTFLVGRPRDTVFGVKRREANGATIWNFPGHLFCILKRAVIFCPWKGNRDKTFLGFIIVIFLRRILNAVVSIAPVHHDGFEIRLGKTLSKSRRKRV